MNILWIDKRMISLQLWISSVVSAVYIIPVIKGYKFLEDMSHILQNFITYFKN
jgi:hypothetical protein